MSILDNLVDSKLTQKDYERRFEVAQSFISDYLEEAGKSTDPFVQQRLEMFKLGANLAEVYGISEKEQDLMLAKAFQAIEYRQFEKAKTLLRILNNLDPLNFKPIYGYGVVLQLEGQYKLAVSAFIKAMQLGATNPDPYLRMGECLMAVGEKGNARVMFNMALTFAEKGKGTSGSLKHAQTMLKVLEQAKDLKSQEGDKK